MILGVRVLELSSGNHFTGSSHRDLDLWPSDLKINRGHQWVMINVPMKFPLTFDLVTWELIGVTCQSWSMYLWSLMILGVSFLELSSGNHFTVSSHRDLDLWPSDLNINRGHLPVMINVPMKFHDPRRKRSWVIIRKPFYCFESLWPWPLT